MDALVLPRYGRCTTATSSCAERAATAIGLRPSVHRSVRAQGRTLHRARRRRLGSRRPCANGGGVRSLSSWLQFLCPPQRKIDLVRRRLFRLLDEHSDNHNAPFVGRDVKRACNAGFALQADLSDLPADVAHVRFSDIRQADGFDQLCDPDESSPHVRRQFGQFGVDRLVQRLDGPRHRGIIPDVVSPAERSALHASTYRHFSRLPDREPIR